MQSPIACPECGAVLRESPGGGPSLELTCPRCAWTAATTDLRTPPFDPRRYTVFAVSTLPPREAAVRLAVALGRPAREMVAAASGDEPLATSVDALEALRIAGTIAPRGIAVRTEPTFPWPLPAVGGAG